MLFSEFYKIMVKKVTFLGFRGDDRFPPWIRPCLSQYKTNGERLWFNSADKDKNF